MVAYDDYHQLKDHHFIYHCNSAYLFLLGTVCAKDLFWLFTFVPLFCFMFVLHIMMCK